MFNVLLEKIYFLTIKKNINHNKNVYTVIKTNFNSINNTFCVTFMWLLCERNVKNIFKIKKINKKYSY